MARWVTAEDLEDPTLADADEAASAASLILYALSGRKYPGLITVTEAFECESSAIRRGTFCRTHTQGVRLRRPVRRIHYVVADATTANRRVIPASEYRLVNRTHLKPTRTATWHTCSDLEITYTYGAEPPQAGRRAAILLGNQLLKARIRPDECELPSRVTSISRQGISMTMLDPQDFLDDGRTGLYEVDLFLKAVNPDKARVRSRVFSPDVKYGGEQISEAVVHGASEYDLIINQGLLLSRTFMWSAGGVPQPITGEWNVTAIVRDPLGNEIADLSEYLIIESAGETGRIDLEIPANITETLNIFGNWDIRLTRADDPGVVISLLSGNVATVGS